jgi:hypothetical protein
MKRIINTAMTLALVGALGVPVTNDVYAQQKEIAKARGAQFVDQNGDGVCDNFGTKAGQQKMGNGQRAKGYGSGDGTGNMGQGPKDGTGYGKAAGNGTGICDGTGPKGGAGTGVCDGTGPKGMQGRGRNK